MSGYSRLSADHVMFSTAAGNDPAMVSDAYHLA
jgi:hypothetical protein